MTATTINLGNVSTKSGGFGEDQFTPFYYGAAAYFNDLNARGGINGRKVVFNFCDDGGTSAGDSDCVRRFVDEQKIFAQVASVCLVCDGQVYANDKGVPSVSGFTIDFRAYALKHFYPYAGNPYPTGGQLGWKGKFYQPNFQYSYLKKKLNLSKAGVLYYDNSIASKSQGLAVAAALRSVGLQVWEYPQNVALPNWDSAVADMKARGVQAVWDSLDIGGNQNLCKSINGNGLKLTAKVSTIAIWSKQVATQFSPPCRGYIYSVEEVGAVSYDETSNPEIAKFRAAMKTYFPDRESKLFQWSVDGWASAMWFTDAAASCGAALTRLCLEKYLSNPAGYAAHGLWFPGTHSNRKINFDTTKGETRCIHYAKWDETAMDFRSIAPMSQSCGYGDYVAIAAS